MNIFITGATSGIGKIIAKELENEHNVFISGRNIEALNKYHNKCKADLTIDEDVQVICNYIIDNKIDILINNAGEYLYSNIETYDFNDIEHMIKLNLISPLKLISKAIPHMKSQKFGRIINIGSISGVMGEAGASIYSASKAGLVGATKALALELAEYGITINTINPGWVETDMGNNSVNESGFSKDEIIECIPQKRFISPLEIADMIKYLISPAAKGVTGQSINLCAGLSVGY